ncbi:hypothetical protein ACN42_g10260 [Penicillium freii]|uniref:Uncharacterized protein n=1 Tax=Penicillium freii TaxID=48697 RepID=A0A117NL03_PENFR|nr:hypothetical protein ACN42_g10260 [Penicillium freii]
MTSTTQDESNNPATESEISKNIRRGKKNKSRERRARRFDNPQIRKDFFEKAGGEPVLIPPPTSDRNLHPHSSGTHVQFSPRLPVPSD